MKRSFAALLVLTTILTGCGDGSSSPTTPATEGGQRHASDTSSPSVAASFDDLPGQELTFSPMVLSANDPPMHMRLKVLKTGWAPAIGDQTAQPGIRWLVVSVAVVIDRAPRSTESLRLARIELRTTGGGTSCPGELMFPQAVPPGTCVGRNKVAFAAMVPLASDWESQKWAPSYGAKNYQPGEVYVGAAAHDLPDTFAPDRYQLCVPAEGSVDLGKGPCIDLDVPNQP